MPKKETFARSLSTGSILFIFGDAGFRAGHVVFRTDVVFFFQGRRRSFRTCFSLLART